MRIAAEKARAGEGVLNDWARGKAKASPSMNTIACSETIRGFAKKKNPSDTWNREMDTNNVFAGMSAMIT